jgi:hypothetical protein
MAAWRLELRLGERLRIIEDNHRRELQALEQKLMKRVRAAERLCDLVLFEHRGLKKDLINQHAEKREPAKKIALEEEEGWIDVYDNKK